MNRVEPNRNVYVGHRYVPLLVGEWDKSVSYEGLSIVTYQGASYTSKKMTPQGIDIENEEYWVLTGNYDSQVEYYRQDVERVQDEIRDTKEYVDDEIILLHQDNEQKFNTFKSSVEDDITNFENKIVITPDDFEGTDIEKLQKSYDYALDNNINNIQLTRKYDITGGSIDIRENYFPFEHMIFTGGEIIKNDEGYIFDSSGENNTRNSPQFIGTIFRTDTDNVYLYNGNKMLRQNTTSCTFYKVGLVESDDYLQSIRMMNCETGQLGCDFIKSKNAFDTEIIAHRGEQSSSPYHFMSLVTDESNALSFYSLRLQGIWEGYTVTSPFNLGPGYGLSVHAYFEANKTSLYFVRGIGTNRLSGDISKCTFGRNLSDEDIFFEDGINTDYLNISENTSTGEGIALINRHIRSAVDNKNNLPTGKQLFTNANAISVVRKNYDINISESDTEGIDYEFIIPTNNVNNINNSDVLQFFINIVGNYGNSQQYRGHLTGILSIDFFFIGETVKGEMTFDVLSARSTNGRNDGDSGVDTQEFDFYFKETGDKTIPTNAKNPTVVFNLPNYVMNNKNSISVKGINGIIQEYMDNY